MSKKSIKNIAFIALGAVILGVCSWITLPFAVPFTLQTFGLFLLYFIFGVRRTTASTMVYILMGILGIPVFSGFGSGLGVILGPTGGFLFGFVLSGSLCMALEWIFGEKATNPLVLIFVVLTTCYAVGTGWYMFWCRMNDSEMEFIKAFLVCVLPYVPFDILKSVFALKLSKRISRFISV